MGRSWQAGRWKPRLQKSVGNRTWRPATLSRDSSGDGDQRGEEQEEGMEELSGVGRCWLYKEQVGGYASQRKLSDFQLWGVEDKNPTLPQEPTPPLSALVLPLQKSLQFIVTNCHPDRTRISVMGLSLTLPHI